MYEVFPRLKVFKLLQVAVIIYSHELIIHHSMEVNKLVNLVIEWELIVAAT